jgi:hypothetical protein
MRRPVRPFVKEFKTRSANASPIARQSGRTSAETTAVFETPQPRVETNDFLPPPPPPTRASNPSDAYEAAMRAADAVFGKNLQTVPIVPGSGAPVGRVLPSLVETSVFSNVEPADQEVKKRRGRPPGKANKPPAVLTKKPAATAKRPSPVKRASTPKPVNRPVPEPQFFEAPPINRQPAVVNSAGDDGAVVLRSRPRRPIQERWVLKTALKPGERWKRRLCGPAR